LAYEVEEKVRCTETGLFGKVLDREWENGWTYTIITDDDKYFYRNEREIEYA